MFQIEAGGSSQAHPTAPKKETPDITGWPTKTAPAVQVGLKEHALVG
jgi:hypothetical protein